MPEKKTLERARRAKRQGKAASTQAGEFVREEMRHVRAGKHGARSTKQAIAIGLSKARRAGVALPPPETAPEKTRASAARDLQQRNERPAARRSRAIRRALQREGGLAASTAALSSQAKRQARERSPAERRRSARQAARTRRRTRRGRSRSSRPR
jgi:hypothetical protein